MYVHRWLSTLSGSLLLRVGEQWKVVFNTIGPLLLTILVESFLWTPFDRMAPCRGESPFMHYFNSQFNLPICVGLQVRWLSNWAFVGPAATHLCMAQLVCDYGIGTPPYLRMASVYHLSIYLFPYPSINQSISPYIDLSTHLSSYLASYCAGGDYLGNLWKARQTPL